MRFSFFASMKRVEFEAVKSKIKIIEEIFENFSTMEWILLPSSLSFPNTQNLWRWYWITFSFSSRSWSQNFSLTLLHSLETFHFHQLHEHKMKLPEWSYPTTQLLSNLNTNSSNSERNESKHTRRRNKKLDLFTCLALPCLASRENEKEEECGLK